MQLIRIIYQHLLYARRLLLNLLVINLVEYYSVYIASDAVIDMSSKQ